MNLDQLTEFLMWSCIINAAILSFWSVFILLAPDLVYNVQKSFIPIKRESFDKFMYFFLGFYKILFYVFNLVPYVALVILQS